MPRRAPDSQPLYADDSSTDEESQPVVKSPSRRGLKKRVSEVYRDPGAAPKVNDDAAEKRRRRKSTKTLNVVNGDENETAARGARMQRQEKLKTVAQETQGNIQVQQDTYEEWMKLATDNKINAANSWNVALIDYFHDMSLLRNDDDNSINFQRASCTLDGCVKIWTSRVDSVNTETGKLLNNLGNAVEAEQNGSDEEGDDDDPSNLSQGGGKKGKPKKANVAILANSYENIQGKKLDLEFAVDPLFKKTCADFDEGGAGGLLMNHLSLGIGTDGSMRVVFDAGDTMVALDDEEEQNKMDEPESRIDFARLREFMPQPDEVTRRSICPSLEGFSFSRQMNDPRDQEPAAFYASDDDDDDENEPFTTSNMDVDTTGPATEEDFFTGGEAINEDFGYAGPTWGEDGGDDAGSQQDDGSTGGDDASAPPQSGGRPSIGGAGFEDFDPRKAPSRKDLLVTMGGGDGNEYFDPGMMRNWAGPEHWKTRRVIRKPDDSKPAAKRKTKEKEVFKIDFLTPQEESHNDLRKKYFAPPDKLSSLLLPKAKASSSSDDFLLPDDMHFEPRQLVTLFLKPKFTVKMRKHGVSLTDMDASGGEVNEAYWAKDAAEAEKEESDDPFLTQGGGAIPFNTQFLHDDDDDDNNAFDLGFDDPGPLGGDAGFGTGLGPPVEEAEEDLLASTQQASQNRRVKPEFVKFSKRAKRVDVRKLKENIWKGLDIVVDKTIKPLPEDEDEEIPPEEEHDESKPDPTPASEARPFASVLNTLGERYPKDKMDEISTSFCFICLLHLANEQGLRLGAGGVEQGEDGNDNFGQRGRSGRGSKARGGGVDEEEGGEEDEKKIKNIWDLKVYRDPEAFVGL
ncbi:barren [Flagelloscypha sp. PMI_526]|nr:barren [Flagelloscypha sp. PMI_526]